MDVARLNFSHGDLVDHERRIGRIRKAFARTKRNVGIMMDSRGPEIRIGTFEEGKVKLHKGHTFTLTTEDIIGDENRVSVTYKGIVNDVGPGKKILLDDGLIKLLVKEVREKEVICVVEYGGELHNRKSINLPGVSVNLPPMCEKDKEDIIYGISQDLDFLAASYVRRASDIMEIRNLLEENKGRMKVIAKIENEEGVKNIDKILEVSDGVMVARGDLGVEIPAEDVPLVQKEIIEKCNQKGMPVITATQMLDSMIRNPRPTRAEASDVANAIFDGTDAVMLSGESAIGGYPVESVRVMDRIALRAETALRYDEIMESFGPQTNRTVTDAISYSTCYTAKVLGASAILSSTQSGQTARMVSKYKPRAPIIAVTPNHNVVRYLTLTWGVYPIICSPTENTDEMFEEAIKAALKARLIKNGELIVITAGVPIGVGTTNLLRVHTVGQVLVRGTGIGKEAVTGKAFPVRSPQEADRIKENGILVVYGTDRDYVPSMEKARGIIAEEGGLTSHTAVVALSIGVPVVVGAKGAMEKLEKGLEITIDPMRGLVYQGKVKVL